MGARRDHHRAPTSPALQQDFGPIPVQHPFAYLAWWTVVRKEGWASVRRCTPSTTRSQASVRPKNRVGAIVLGTNEHLMDLWVVRKIHNALICATTLDMCCSACRQCPQRPVKTFMTTYTLGRENRRRRRRRRRWLWRARRVWDVEGWEVVALMGDVTRITSCVASGVYQRYGNRGQAIQSVPNFIPLGLYSCLVAIRSSFLY